MKKKAERGRCIECRLAYLMKRDDLNPIIAQCEVTGERYAARVHICTIERFERNTSGITYHKMAPIR